jgi:hypothetical protein
MIDGASGDDFHNVNFRAAASDEPGKKRIAGEFHAIEDTAAGQW